jgi:two-component system response regulator YesN
MPNVSLLERLKKTPGMIRDLNAFSEMCRIPLQLMSSKGEKIWKADPYESKAHFCRILQSERGPAKTCRIAHKKAVQESIRWGEAMIGRCCHSFMQITAPVMDHGRLEGYLIASPFLLFDPADLQPEELAFLHKRPGKKRFEKALSSISIIKDNEASQTAKTLFHLADRLSTPDLSCLRKVREIQELQGKIADQIRDLKALEKDLNPSSLTKLSYEQEKEIIAKIRLGDRLGAKEILYRLLAILLTQYLENFELLKISILELLIILTRAAVEAGTKIEEVLGMRYRFITESAGIKDQENLCIWVVQLLDKLMDGIYETRHAKNYQRLKEVLDFIERHGGESLTVDQIAKEVYLSSSRLSHIIKNELGITLGDYISKVRVEKAKFLLKDRELPISQIALEVGFPDQSYFTKVFKKVERCTPKEFRQKSFRPSSQHLKN